MENKLINTIPNLAAELQKGNSLVLEELIKSYSTKIFYSCKKMSLDNDEAKDVCQEVFIKLWESRTHLDEQKSIDGLIFTIAKNVILKKIRRKTYATILEKYWINTYPGSSNPTEELIDLKELENLTTEFINRLPGAQRKIVSMRMLDGLSNDEIAEKLHLSKRTVENQVYRAYKRLRIYLTK